METVDELFNQLHGQDVSKKARIEALKKLSNKIDLNNLDYDYQGAIQAGMVPDKEVIGIINSKSYHI